MVKLLHMGIVSICLASASAHSAELKPTVIHLPPIQRPATAPAKSPLKKTPGRTISTEQKDKSLGERKKSASLPNLFGPSSHSPDTPKLFAAPVAKEMALSAKYKNKH